MTETSGAEGPAIHQQPDAAAVSLALAASGQSERVAAKAEAFFDKQNQLLEEQAKLTRLQIARIRVQDDQIEEEQRLEMSHLRVRRLGDYLKSALEIAAGIVLTIVFVGLGALVWQAVEADGLVVEPLHTPPDLAERGLDGTVLAQQLLDRLNVLVEQSQENAFNKANRAYGNWGNDAKVLIPETGVSISELSRALRGWVGSEKHISGEVWHTSAGIAVTVRVPEHTSINTSGAESDLATVLDGAALALFEQTQPLRYISLFLFSDPAKAETVARRLAESATEPDSVRSWGLIYLVMVLSFEGRNREAVAAFDRAGALALENPVLYIGRQNGNYALGHGDPTIKDLEYELPLYDRLPRDADIASVDTLKMSMQSWLAELKGAFGDALVVDVDMQRRSSWNYDAVGWLITASDSARNHDTRAARELLAEHPTADVGEAIRQAVLTNYVLPAHAAVEFEEGSADGAARELQTADREAEKYGMLEDVRHTLIWPWLAYALAAGGHSTDAAELIAKTPLDCTLCLEMRGRVAELAGDFPAAEQWFGRAAADAPSMPFALTDWGAMRMRRGNYAAAIEKFEQANTAGPHFADPLEMWGETLLLDNHADLALSKFEEANRYAPHWARLHLKWAEALEHLGRKDEARAQRQLAASLDQNTARRTGAPISQ